MAAPRKRMRTTPHRDVANNLFPIIHERRIQGVAIERLRYRWAATNPPLDAQDSDAYSRYDGVETLDPALAARFALIVSLPRFADLADADRRLIIGGIGDAPSPSAANTVRQLVHATKALIPTMRAESGLRTHRLCRRAHRQAVGLQFKQHTTEITNVSPNFSTQKVTPIRLSAAEFAAKIGQSLVAMPIASTTASPSPPSVTLPPGALPTAPTPLPSR